MNPIVIDRSAVGVNFHMACKAMDDGKAVRRAKWNKSSRLDKTTIGNKDVYTCKTFNDKGKCTNTTMVSSYDTECTDWVVGYI